MSEAEAPKPVEALQPEAEAAPTTQPTEEKPVGEQSDQKTEEVSEKSEEKPEEKKEVLKTTAKHDNENPRNNRKFDPSSREVTDDPDAIRKQVCIALFIPPFRARAYSSRSSSTLVTGTSPKTSSCGSHAAEAKTSP